MGLFKNIKKIINNYTESENTELAFQLFNTQALGSDIDKKYLYKVNNILKECTLKNNNHPDRQQVLLKVINLIGEPATPKERYLVAKAYAWSRVEYRKKAIYYLELYLNNILWENAPAKSELHHLNEMYTYLAKAYEGIYDFDKCLEIYEYLISIFPNNPPAYRGKVNILIKQNKLNECLVWIESLKKSEYYKIKTYTNEYGQKIKDDWFNSTINELLVDVKNKISNGYKYIPKNN